MLPIAKIIWHELSCSEQPERINEPEEAMDNPEQVAAYIQAYEWGGPTSALQLHHLKELSHMIRPGDTVLDLACGPGPLLLELAEIYPKTQFIGADLSPTMLKHIEQTAAKLDLKNVSVLCEDVRHLPSIDQKEVDLVITTSALHHLPNEKTVQQVFSRIRSLLKDDGGFYIFDFGQLKSAKARALCVADVARLAPPITAKDYELSLQAAYPIDLVYQIAKEELPKPFTASASAFVNFFFFLQTGHRAIASDKVKSHICRRSKSLSYSMRAEHFMLRWLKRSQLLQ